MNNLKDLVLSLIEAKPFAVVTDDEQWVTITRHFTVDPERYISTSYKPPRNGAPKPPPAAVKAVKPVTAPSFAKDEAIAQDISSCEATAAECRAANPLYCPYHGTMIIQEDIRQRMVTAGIRGNINVDMDDTDADKETGKGFSVTVTCPSEQAELVKQQLNAFLQTPGISLNDASLDDDGAPELMLDRNGDGRTTEGGMTMYYDVDTLMADQPPANAAVLQEGNANGQGETDPSSNPNQQAQPDETQAPETSTETDPVEELVSTLGEGQREFIQEAINSYRETGKFHSFPLANNALERQFKAILGENHPLFGGGGQEGQQTNAEAQTAEQEPPQPQQEEQQQAPTEIPEEPSETQEDTQPVQTPSEAEGQTQEPPQQEAAAATPPSPPTPPNNPPTPPEENNEPQAQAAGGNPPDNPPHNNLTDADIEDAVSRIASANPSLPEEAIRSEINRLRTGEGISQLMSSYADQAAALLGEDHPVIRALREQTGNANTQEQTNHPEQQTPPPQTEETNAQTQTPPPQHGGENRDTNQTATENANADLGRVVQEDGTVTYTALQHNPYYGDPDYIARRTPYTWPFRRGVQPTADQITPQLINQVLANVPTGAARNYSHMWNANLLRSVLANPRNMDNYTTGNLVDKMMRSPNPHAKRYMQILNALHPTVVEDRQRRINEREEQARQNRLRNQRHQMAYQVGNLANQAANNAENDFSDEDYRQMTDQLMNALPDYVPQVEQGINALRNGAVPDDEQLRRMADVFGTDSSFVERLKARQTAQKAARRRARRFRITELPAAVQQANDEVFGRADIQRSARPLKSVRVTGSPHGCVCYATNQAIRARIFGYAVDTKMENGGYSGENRERFIKSRGQMKEKGFEMLNRGTSEETASNLERIRQTYPNGTYVDCWRGQRQGHGTGAVLIDKRWYAFDGYYGGNNYWMPETSGQVALRIDNIPTELPDDVTPETRTGRQYIMTAKRNLPISERNKFTPQELMKMGYQQTITEAPLMSYVMKPDDGFCDDTLLVLQKSANTEMIGSDGESENNGED